MEEEETLGAWLKKHGLSRAVKFCLGQSNIFDVDGVKRINKLTLDKLDVKEKEKETLWRIITGLSATSCRMSIDASTQWEDDDLADITCARVAESRAETSHVVNILSTTQSEQTPAHYQAREEPSPPELRKPAPRHAPTSAPKPLPKPRRLLIPKTDTTDLLLPTVHAQVPDIRTVAGTPIISAADVPCQASPEEEDDPPAAVVSSYMHTYEQGNTYKEPADIQRLNLEPRFYEDEPKREDDHGANDELVTEESDHEIYLDVTDTPVEIHATEDYQYIQAAPTIPKRHVENPVPITKSPQWTHTPVETHESEDYQDTRVDHTVSKPHVVNPVPITKSPSWTHTPVETHELEDYQDTRVDHTVSKPHVANPVPITKSSSWTHTPVDTYELEDYQDTRVDPSVSKPHVANPVPITKSSQWTHIPVETHELEDYQDTRVDPSVSKRHLANAVPITKSSQWTHTLPVHTHVDEPEDHYEEPEQYPISAQPKYHISSDVNTIQIGHSAEETYIDKNEHGDFLSSEEEQEYEVVGPARSNVKPKFATVQHAEASNKYDQMVQSQDTTQSMYLDCDYDSFDELDEEDEDQGIEILDRFQSSPETLKSICSLIPSLPGSEQPHAPSTKQFYKIPVTEVSRCPELRLRKIQCGEANRFSTARSMLMIGETGAGKSTMIDAIINYIAGIQDADPFRFSIIDTKGEDAPVTRSTTASQTDWITSYTLNSLPGCHLPFPLNIIDTPGFADTRGIDRDQTIVKQITELFASREGYGLDQLDLVCFVIPSSTNRMKTSTKYVIDEVLSVFAKDMKKNICVMLTHSDGSPPGALQILDDAKVPYEKTFQFNNLWMTFTSLFAALYWKTGKEEFSNLMEFLKSREPTSLKLSADVLGKREELEAAVAGLHRLIEMITGQLVTIRNMKSNVGRALEVEISVPEQTTILEKSNDRNLNCQHHKVTCKANCDKIEHIMFKLKSKNAQCQVCKCPLKNHKAQRKSFNVTVIESYKTIAECRKRFGTDGDSDVVRAMEDKACDLEDELDDALQRMRTCITELDNIALRPQMKNTGQYIDMVIKKETFDQKPGYKDRVKALEGLRRNDSLLRVARNRHIRGKDLVNRGIMEEKLKLQEDVHIEYF